MSLCLICYIVSTIAHYNCIQDVSSAIRLFAGLALCSLVELGYDPTIRRVHGALVSEECFDIDVFDQSGVVTRTYRTKCLLADYGAEALHGRGTRVWEVYDYADQEKVSCVLKDTWVSSDRQREGVILEDIKTRLRESHADDSLLEHFLTVVCAGDVHVSDVPDTTNNRIRRGQHLKPLRWIRTNSAISAAEASIAISSASSSVGGVPSPWRRTRGREILNVSRDHYRIVFAEVGKAQRNHTTMQN